MLQNALIQLLKSPQASLIYQGKTYSSRQLVNRALSLLPALEKIKQNNPHLAFCLPNSPELLCYYLACFYLGLPIVPLIYEQTPKAIQESLELTQTPHLITTTEKKKALVKSKLRFKCSFILCDERDQSLSSPSTATGARSFLSPSSAQNKDLAMIIFSSGTSGRLKGIMHSYQSFWAFLEGLNEVLAVDKGLIYLIAQPMGHIGGIITTLLTLVNQGCAILQKDFEISTYLQAMEQYQPTHINLHTPLFYELIHAPQLQRKAFNRLKTCFAGGDDIPADLPEQFTELTAAPMRIGYGMTEIGIVTVNPSPYRDHKGSCGKVIKLAHTEILIKDEAGLPVKQGTTGEIWVKSPACCLGYWDLPLLNKKTLVDGWFRTGDLAYQDNEGYYWYRGRLSQVIHRGGATVYPQAIEQVLYDYPGVKAAATIGIHSTKEGEVPIAFVELSQAKPPRDFNKGLIEYLQQHLQSKQIPRKVLVLKKLPLNMTGKIDRLQLQKIYLNEVSIP